MKKIIFLIISISLLLNTLHAKESKKDNMVCDIYICLEKEIANLPASNPLLREQGYTLIKQRKFGADLLIAGIVLPFIPGMWIAGAVYLGQADVEIAKRTDKISYTKLGKHTKKLASNHKNK